MLTANNNELRLTGVGPAQTSCREEHDGAGDRNQHPHRVYFRNDRGVTLVISSLVSSLVISSLVSGKRQDRENQRSGHQSGHRTNAAVKSANRHAMTVGGI